ncbi:DUF5345 family protein [Sutcliffiella cohnii]
MSNHQDQDVIKALQEDWNNIDELAGEQHLSHYAIQQQVQLFQQKRKKAFYKELTFFIMIAIFILSLFLTTISKGMQIAFYIQLLAAIIGPVVYFFLLRREERKAWR